MANEKSIKAAEFIAEEINNMGFNYKDFAKAMSTEHRTLQSDFTELCIQWLETQSKQYDNGDYDGRNETACKAAKKMIDALYK